MSFGLSIFHKVKRASLPSLRLGAWVGRLRRSKPAKTEASRETLLQVCERVRSRLSGLTPDLEKIFIRLGERLVHMDEQSRDLARKSKELLELAGVSQEGEVLIVRALGILKEPLAYIDYCMQEHERLLVLLEKCEQRTHGMLGVRARMHDAIAPLTFMAVLFKIESAYLPPELRETFLTVTVEVERLHKLVDETFAQNAEQLERAHGILSSVRRRLSQDLERQGRHVEEKRKGIDNAIRTLNEQLSHNSERHSQLHRHSDALQAEVSKVVMGIQFEDIVKQKCEHVIAALDGSPASLARHNIQLQSAQLHAVAKDLDEGCGSVREGLSRIEDLGEQLNHSSVSLESFESMTAAMDGMVQLILDTMVDVQEIIGMVTQLTRQAHEAVQPANGIARNLTTVIVELSVNMRLIALNAQIRSVQGGQGTGLEVLAARTSDISDEISGIGDQVSAELAELHASIDQMLSTFQEFVQRGEAREGELTQSRGENERSLHAFRDRALQVVQAIGDGVQAVHETVQDIQQSILGLPEFTRRLQAEASALEAQIGEGEGDVDAGQHLVEHAKRYTMASERELHDTLFSSAAVAGAATVLSVAGEETPPEETAISAPLGQEKVVPEKEPSPKKKETEDFGDNVDLF